MTTARDLKTSLRGRRTEELDCFFPSDSWETRWGLVLITEQSLALPSGMTLLLLFSSATLLASCHRPFVTMRGSLTLFALSLGTAVASVMNRLGTDPPSGHLGQARRIFSPIVKGEGERKAGSEKKAEAEVEDFSTCLSKCTGRVRAGIPGRYYQLKAETLKYLGYVAHARRNRRPIQYTVEQWKKTCRVICDMVAGDEKEPEWEEEEEEQQQLKPTWGVAPREGEHDKQPVGAKKNSQFRPQGWGVPHISFQNIQDLLLNGPAQLSAAVLTVLGFLLGTGDLDALQVT